MRPIEYFLFCPRCARSRQNGPDQDAFACPGCGFVYYFNPALAVVGMLLNAHREALFIRRAKDPGKGKLGFPGGFIDAGETAERALTRELHEELGIELGPLNYVCSVPNTYSYKEVAYSVLDIFFLSAAGDLAVRPAREEVQSFCWIRPSEVDHNDLAFPSHGTALTTLLAQPLFK